MAGENYMVQNLIHNFFWSPIIIRMMKSWKLEWASYVTCPGKRRNAYKVMIGELGGKKPLGRPGHRWVGKIRMDLNKKANQFF